MASSVLDKKERRDEKGAGRGRAGRGRAGRGRGRGRPRKAPDAPVPDEPDPSMSSDGQDVDAMKDAKELVSTPEPVRGRVPRSPEPVAQNLAGPELVAQNLAAPEQVAENLGAAEPVAQNPSPEIKQESKKQKTLAAQEGRRLKAEDALARVRQCSHQDLQPEPGFDKVCRGCKDKRLHAESDGLLVLNRLRSYTLKPRDDALDGVKGIGVVLYASNFYVYKKMGDFEGFQALWFSCQIQGFHL